MFTARSILDAVHFIIAEEYVASEGIPADDVVDLFTIGDFIGDQQEVALSGGRYPDRDIIASPAERRALVLLLEDYMDYKGLRYIDRLWELLISLSQDDFNDQKLRQLET